MFKKLSVFLIISVLVVMFSSLSFAENQDVIYSNDIKPTEQFIVKITRPDGNESTFKKSYVICGMTSIENVSIKLLKQNAQGTYEDFINTDDESTWEIGSSGIFMKEVVLGAGANNIRIVAFKNNEATKVVVGETYQISDFKVTLLEETIKDKLKSGIQIMKDIFK